MVIVLLLMLLLTPGWHGASASCSDTPGIVDFEPFHQNGDQENCSPQDLDNTLGQAATNQGLPQPTFLRDSRTSNSPTCTLGTLLVNGTTHNLFFLTHGFEDPNYPADYGGICTDVYADSVSAAAVASAYEIAYHLTANTDIKLGHAQDPNGNPEWGILLCPTGIEKAISPSLSPSALIFGGYCNSYSGASSWGITTNPDRTFIGWECAGFAPIACTIAWHVYSGLGCIDDPPSGPTVGNVVDSHPLEMFFNSFAASGNRSNTLSCDKTGCEKQPYPFFVRADGTKVVWTFGTDHGNGRFFVRTYRAWDRGAVPETLATVPADGSGYYSLPAAPHGVAVDVVYSDGLRTPETTSRAPIEAEVDPTWGRRLPLEARVPGSAQVTEPPAGRSSVKQPGAGFSGVRMLDNLFPPCTECADFVVYTSYGHEDMAQRVQMHLGRYKNEYGTDFAARVVIGPRDASGVTQVLRDAWAANVDWNASHCVFDPNGGDPSGNCYVTPPTLVIVGSADLVYQKSFPDDEYETCADPCFSYYDYADLWSDSRPDCPVQVIPADNYAELNAYLSAVDRWNEGNDVSYLPSVQIFSSDEHDGVGPIVPDHRCAFDVGGIFDNHGYPASYLFESASPLDPQERHHMGVTAINAGIRYLWVQGRGVNRDHWTDFLLDSGIRALTTQQLILAVAPSCNSLWSPWQYGHGEKQNIAHALMFADSSNLTRAVGVVGQLNSDWDTRHREFARTFAERLAGASQGSTLSDLLFQQVSASDSEDVRYGRGYVFYGGYVTIAGDISGVQGAEGSVQATRLRMLRNPAPGHIEMQWAVPKKMKVRLEVFDVAGRRLGTIFDGEAEPGARQVRWPDVSGRPLYNGIYFVRLQAGADVRRARVVVIK